MIEYEAQCAAGKTSSGSSAGYTAAVVIAVLSTLGLFFTCCAIIVKIFCCNGTKNNYEKIDGKDNPNGNKEEENIQPAGQQAN